MTATDKVPFGKYLIVIIFTISFRLATVDCICVHIYSTAKSVSFGFWSMQA